MQSVGLLPPLSFCTCNVDALVLQGIRLNTVYGGIGCTGIARDSVDHSVRWDWMHTRTFDASLGSVCHPARPPKRWIEPSTGQRHRDQQHADCCSTKASGVLYHGGGKMARRMLRTLFPCSCSCFSLFFFLFCCCFMHSRARASLSGLDRRLDRASTCWCGLPASGSSFQRSIAVRSTGPI